MARLLLSLAAVACAFLMACGGSEPTVDACLEIEGQTYYSVEQYECGQGPGGTEMCNWTISFSSSNFDWSFSDIVSSGTYACEGADITAMTTGNEFFGTLSVDGILTFNEIDYQLGQ